MLEDLSSVQNMAIWGAVTGTIGTVTGILSFILRFRHQKRDRAKLFCEADFSYELSNGKPNQKYGIIIRSVGRRPVSLDQIGFQYIPDNWKDRIIRQFLWRKGQFTGTDSIDRNKTITLPEGQKYVHRLSDFHVKHMEKTGRVFIRDQTGRKWKVRWPRPHKLKTLNHYEELQLVNEESASVKCQIIGFEHRDEFRIYAYRSPKPSGKGPATARNYAYKNRSEYDEKMQEIVDNQLPKILEEELQGFT